MIRKEIIWCSRRGCSRHGHFPACYVLQPAFAGAFVSQNKERLRFCLSLIPPGCKIDSQSAAGGVQVFPRAFIQNPCWDGGEIVDLLAADDTAVSMTGLNRFPPLLSPSLSLELAAFASAPAQPVVAWNT